MTFPPACRLATRFLVVTAAACLAAALPAGVSAALAKLGLSAAAGALLVAAAAALGRWRGHDRR